MFTSDSFDIQNLYLWEKNIIVDYFNLSVFYLAEFLVVPGFLP